MSTRRTRLAALAVTLPLALGGCASALGVHDAPAEITDGPSITQSAGAEVTQRVLGEAAVALDSQGKGSSTDRKQALTGPALEAADARHQVGQVEDQHGSLTPPSEAKVIAVSRGTDWPRSILATSQQGSEQQLHVLVADGPRSPYRLFASLPMAAGASIPALQTPEQGVDVRSPKAVTGKDLGVASTWAQAVAFPAPKKTPEKVSVDDPFSTALRDNASAQQRKLGKLATYTVSHKPGGDGIVFPLADGGKLTVTSLTRTDTITAGEETKELTLPDDLAELVGEDTVSSTLRVTHLETMAFVEPKGGDVTVVAASEQITGAKGS